MAASVFFISGSLVEFVQILAAHPIPPRDGGQGFTGRGLLHQSLVQYLKLGAVAFIGQRIEQADAIGMAVGWKRIERFHQFQDFYHDTRWR